MQSVGIDRFTAVAIRELQRYHTIEVGAGFKKPVHAPESSVSTDPIVGSPLNEGSLCGTGACMTSGEVTAQTVLDSSLFAAVTEAVKYPPNIPEVSFRVLPVALDREEQPEGSESEELKTGDKQEYHW